MMTRPVNLGGIALCLIISHAHATEPPVTVDQGSKWTEANRYDFYSGNQGSRLIPLAWINALKQADGQPFMADSLSRYGFLPNPKSKAAGLPVGFTLDSDGATLGITCAACHTRQIEHNGKAYRIDGGPAITDFQSFLTDLDKAAGKALSDPAVFAEFSKVVAGEGPAMGRKGALRDELQAWYASYHLIMERSLPTDKPWGYGRLDAVSMIFNRVAGLDIGTGPDHTIPENIKVADAPVRYPFLWNAANQDKTQWPGFADNGDNLLGLARNMGEVYGVFAVMHPEKDPDRLLGIDYLAENSADVRGLDDLENLIQKIGPPRWPWGLDKALAVAGKAVYERPTEEGGCVQCHEVPPAVTRGVPRLLNMNTWKTPIMAVGTDQHEYDVLTRTVKTGVLEGARLPLISEQPLKPVDAAANVLSVAIKGAILQNSVPIRLGPQALRDSAQVEALIKAQLTAMEGIYRLPAPPNASGSPGFAYESRVLEGIWATAPYLHNGSVRSLADLLKPAAERTAEFKIGPEYDPVNVGLAVEQPHFGSTLTTTDCSDRKSGSSRCGHEFGTQLPNADKKALLEYLKTL